MTVRTLHLVALAAFLIIAAPDVQANSSGPNIEAGKKLAEQACARCHAIGRDDDSALPVAPPLRTFAAKWPLENLEEAFAEGIITGHAEMPEFKFQPNQIMDLLSYIESVSP